MRRVVRGALILGLTFQMAACGFHFKDAGQVLDFLEGVAEDLGASQITADKDLIGERLCAADAYTGRYLAECDGNTGKDVVFGGASIEGRKLYISGCIITWSGQATIRIRMNEEVIELEPDEDGYFKTELSLDSGGNYICVKFSDFTGTVDLTAGYEPPPGS